ncbi:MAG: F0F1 ATP synthase subunit epsilon [Longibaculum muris]|uniref:ATP synthase epsilon chain n=1 Tax=Longibaculum muris TaxID=1796628 RepID=A0A4R3YVF0_9FIRM|nr:F0F1 ATP synthase subunit epsilon [Longibaculum muris]KXU44541.1 ATP synthase F1, epsilon subunit [Candidatus Stoquefichus sp. KLE1796]MBS5370624.1 F0F1 ATP synthase subunit epsilon [Coprobacillus cateniformis]MCR1888032.1 F0F1 ATP synthase subunit epsilon [Longibaculum muris]MED9811700.1 F0F1 ATP synthase subunit epsilon [Longibaculum muris]TCV95374.1 F-type H+-transporting ATPase subunit epsilon [Longibaculum muris]
MKPFKLKIVTPRGIYKETEVEMLNLRTTSGQIGILANHLPLASAIDISEMNYIKDGQRYKFALAGGFVYVNDDETTIIANAIESPEEIDLRRAQEAKARAEERLHNQSNDDMDILRAEVALRKAITRIRVKNEN